MPDERVDRRLAAIFAGDIAGYSRLMAMDEEGTHARVMRHRRDLIDPTIIEYHGRLVKSTGDGFLAIFDSPVEAVRCAIVIQQSMVGRNAALHVRRVKQGVPSVHPLPGDEMRALRELKRTAASPFVFTSERGAPFTTTGFAKMVARAGEAAKLKGVHPHMLRHACGYALANKGHDTRVLQAYLGHKNIQHTVRYTELSPTRFKDFWRD